MQDRCDDNGDVQNVSARTLQVLVETKMSGCFRALHIALSLGTSVALLTTDHQHALPAVQRQTCGLANVVNINQSLVQHKPSSRDATWQRKKVKCFCREEDDETSDVLEDRREALFAMMGTMWAMGTLPEVLLGGPSSAHAVYGSDANMLFPDIVQGMSDRNTKQCLVESLGNRECLVYQEDEEKLLYKGADVKVLLQRIQIAADALENEIPPLVATKQWIKITGVLTGPMGQLSSTMTLLCKLSDRPDEAKQRAQTVKNDVFAMGTATTNKSADDVIKYQKLAIQDLAIFLKSL